MGFCLSFDLRL